MRRILFALGCTIASVMAGEMGTCQKNCGLDFGKCLITTGDFKTCLETEATCAVSCLSSVQNVKVSKDMRICQKNCGIDYAKCLITQFDINACTKQEAACALDCLKGIKPKAFEIEVKSERSTCEKGCAIDYGTCIISTFSFKSCSKAEAVCALECIKKFPVEINVAQSQDMGVCQKNCAIDYTKCLITTFDMATCTQQEAACALDCLKGVKSKPFEIEVKSDRSTCEKGCGIDLGICMVSTGNFKACAQAEAVCGLECLKKYPVDIDVAQSQDVGVCQKDCAIDYTKCLVTTFDMATCTKQEAACALDCLKSVEVAEVEEVEDVEFSIKCSLCKAGAGKIQSVISKMGCGASDVAITLACETIFLGPEDPIADACAAGFIAACPTLLSWIQNKVFSSSKACSLVHMC